MVNDISIHSLRLSSLPIRTQRLLSLSLNSEKIILSDGPHKLCRDWRGLAFQVGLSSKIESHIRQSEDKTAQVLQMWQHIDSNATVEYLLRYLERMDRYDVADDVYHHLQKAISRGDITANNQNQIAIPNSTYLSSGLDNELITEDDRPGHVQIYDAMVLYAEENPEDAEFSEYMMQLMTDEGYQICTVARLQAGHTTQYAPMSRLMAERCRRVVLVLSPAFLESPAMNYYTNFAAADGIETEQRKIVPIMFRSCELPRHLSYYHKLFYESNKPPLYDFWKKLFQCLEVARMSMPIQQSGSVPSNQTTPLPRITIEDVGNNRTESSLFLPRSDISPSRSMPRLDAPTLSRTENSHSLNNVSEGNRKKKKNYLRKFFSTLKGKKTNIMVAE